MPRHLHGILALLLVTLVWGTTFPAMKDLTGHFSAVWIILVRFALAALLLSPFLLRGKPADMRAGAILGVVATAAIISLQTWGQSRTSANEAAVVYAFEPAAAFFGYVWLGEVLTACGWLGGLLLISGMIVSQWNSESRPSAALAPE